MQIENISRPGKSPADGDLVRILHDSGAVEEKTFFAPVEVDPGPTPIPPLTQLQFRLLLTQEERLAARAARAADVKLDDYLGLLDIAQEVDLSNPLTIGGLRYAAALGVFTDERLERILSGQPPEQQ